jgi:hypothetical protein
VSFGSKFFVKDQTPKLELFDIGIDAPYNFRSGSPFAEGNCENCMHTVFDCENWNPFSSSHFWIPLRQRCIWRSIDIRLFERKHIQKSSTYSDPFTPAGKQLIILFIFNMNNVTDKMVPCGTPISCSYESEKQEPTRTRKHLSFKNLQIKSGNRPRNPAPCRS